MATKYATEVIQEEIIKIVTALNMAGQRQIRRATVHAILMTTVFAGNTFTNTSTYFNNAVDALEQGGKIAKHKKENGREVRFSLI